MKAVRSMFAAMVLLAAAWHFADVALAARGQIGGLAATSGCVRGCFEDSKKTGVTEHDCLRYCECALTIESTRWREEMEASRVAARLRRCAARIWPDRVESARGSKRVLICVPQPFKDEREKNSPAVMKLYTDGTMAKHFGAVDKELDRLKADKQSKLYRTAARSERTVVILLDDHLASIKVRDIVSDRKCPAQQWINDYSFEEWIHAPGRKLPE